MSASAWTRRRSNYRDLLKSDKALYVKFAHALLKRGVRVLERGAWFVSFAHDDAVIDATLEAVRERGERNRLSALLLEQQPGQGVGGGGHHQRQAERRPDARHAQQHIGGKTEGAHRGQAHGHAGHRFLHGMAAILRWLEMAMIEPITGKVVKMPDQCVPSAAANWVMATVSAAPAIMRAGRPHQTCSRSSSEGSPRG